MSNSRLAAARLNACRRWPAATSAILSLIPVEKRGLGTLGVDKYWRLYFDPEYVRTQPDEELIGLILHEVSHLLLKHHARRGGRDAKLWNIAGDLAINDRLQQEGHPLPPDGCFPKDFQLPGNLSAEQYYRHLEDQQNVERDRSAQSETEESDEPADEGDPAAGGDAQAADDDSGSEAEEQAAAEGAGGEGDESQPGAGEPAEGGAGGEPGDCGQPDPSGTGDGPGGSSGEGDQGPGPGMAGEHAATPTCEPVTPGTSGSCSDGILKPWEDPPEAPEGSAEAPPAIQPHEAEQIIQIVAQQTEKACGGGKGSAWADWAGNILHPKIDPKQLLISAIRKAADQTSGGHDDTSYRRPCRRPQVGGVIRPGRVAIVPRICLIIDSSGSMDQRDLGLALGMVSKVLSGFRLRDGVNVVVGDTCAQTTQKVFDPKKVQLSGGGGTDCGAILREVYETSKIKPQLLICVTDGITPWPCEPLPVPVVACLTQQPRSSYPVPKWIKSIVLTA